jgi:hypothetical protein
MLLQTHSWHPDVWTDIARMRTMNTLQAQRGREMHLCPIQFDIVDRMITQYSNEGDTILDFFAGLGTVPYCAVKLKRKGIGIELSKQYFQESQFYLEKAENDEAIPNLLELCEMKS